METQQLRYDNKFDYEINIHADIDINEVEIPPLLLQPFVENAIEHGFKNLNKKGLLKITFSRGEGTICYEIVDNGKGFDLAYKDGKIHAIDIFKKRLKLLGNNDEKFFEIDSSREGTIIKFCLKND
jgi:sensor histidine kinase YesM